MKPLPPPNVPGNTDAERMSNALRMVLKVSKADLLKKGASIKRANDKKRKTTKSRSDEAAERRSAAALGGLNVGVKANYPTS